MFTVMRQVFDQLGLCIGQIEQGAKAVLKREGVTRQLRAGQWKSCRRIYGQP